MSRHFGVPAALLAAALSLTGAAQTAPAATSTAVTSPEGFFGFKMGTDRKLADWQQLTAYYQKLASQSNRVLYNEVGKTTEGRPFVLVTISSPANLAHLDEYRQIQDRLADPRTTPAAAAEPLFARGKTILAITFNIHSTEIASSQTAAEFAYELATRNTPQVRQILDNTILLLVPSLNPDGQQLVVDWYKKYLGTPYEGMNPVVLYNKYTGHDDNRDWYAFTQVETQLTVNKILNPWHPQILYDLHQMGANGPRIYFPPWVDPIDPNVDPIIESGMNAVGMRMALDEAAAGNSGVLVDGVYDGWSPARQYIVYHNGLRILSESASAKIATPIEMPFDRLGTGIGYDAKVARWNFPNPWPGGTWRLGDIVSYQLTALYSIADQAAENRERFLRSFYQVGVNAVSHTDPPYAWVVPPGQRDPLAAARLVNILRTGAVEVGRASAAFTADGHSYPAGSYIVRRAQPYGAFAKTLLERQDYPNLRQYPGGPPQRPYDVTAQTLPLLLGVDVDTIAQPFSASTTPVTKVVPSGHVAAASGGAGYSIPDHNNGALLTLFALLKQHQEVDRSGDGASLFVPASAPAALLQSAATKFAVDLTSAAAPARKIAVTPPRIGIYQSWVAQNDEGWTRWIFDQDGIPYTRVVDADIRKGDLNQRFDAILIPDEPVRALISGASNVPPEYSGGLSQAGMDNLAAFVQGGGTLMALNEAALAFLPMTHGAVTNILDGVANTEFYCPGSILAAHVDTQDPVGWGAQEDAAIFAESGPAFKVSAPARSVVDYSLDPVLLSGWLLGGDRLKGASALAEMPIGRGHLVLFGFKPQYRAQSEATYRLMFNALLLSNEQQ